MPTYLAVDLGAESGRVLRGTLRRRPADGRGGAPVRQPAGAAADRPALERARPVRRRVPRAWRPPPPSDRSTGSASTRGATTSGCSTATGAWWATLATTATRAPRGCRGKRRTGPAPAELYRVTGTPLPADQDGQPAGGDGAFPAPGRRRAADDAAGPVRLLADRCAGERGDHRQHQPALRPTGTALGGRRDREARPAAPACSPTTWCRRAPRSDARGPGPSTGSTGPS